MAFFTREALPPRAASMYVDPAGKTICYMVDGMKTSRVKHDEAMRSILASDELRVMENERDSALSLLGLVLLYLGGSVRILRSEVDEWDWNKWSIVQTRNSGGTHLELTERAKP